MSIKVNQKIIKELCGTVSFKKGEAFFRSNKVTFQQFGPDRYEAVVLGTENFHVVIEKGDHERFHSHCSCPKLVSFQKDCQHIAAVLVAIYDFQSSGTSPIGTDAANRGALAADMLNIFQNKPSRPSRHQHYFENRAVLDLEFIIKVIDEKQGHSSLGMELWIDQTKVNNIMGFLEGIQHGHSSRVSSTFLFDPSLHCFQPGADLVIQQLIPFIHDRADSSRLNGKSLLMIPPSSWKQLQPLLLKAPLVKIEYGGSSFDRLQVKEELPPLKFEFLEDNSNGYWLKVKGLSRMLVLSAFGSVLTDGKIINLNTDDFRHLAEIKQLLDASGTNQLFIPQEQIELFSKRLSRD